jgi:hypothetical protein
MPVWLETSPVTLSGPGRPGIRRPAGSGPRAPRPGRADRLRASARRARGCPDGVRGRRWRRDASARPRDPDAARAMEDVPHHPPAVELDDNVAIDIGRGREDRTAPPAGQDHPRDRNRAGPVTDGLAGREARCFMLAIVAERKCRRVDLGDAVKDQVESFAVLGAREPGAAVWRDDPAPI